MNVFIVLALLFFGVPAALTLLAWIAAAFGAIFGGHK